MSGVIPQLAGSPESHATPFFAPCGGASAAPLRPTVPIFCLPQRPLEYVRGGRALPGLLPFVVASCLKFAERYTPFSWLAGRPF